MEIVGTNLEEEQKNKKKLMTTIIVLIIILAIIAAGLFVLIGQLKEKQFKLIIDKQIISTNKYSSDLFVFQNEQVYVSLKDVASLIGYKFYNGGYKQYTEDTDKCYLESDNEVTTFERDSNKIYKTPTEDLDYTYYTLQEKIVRINGKLYVNSKDLGLSCNLQIEYNKDKNRVIIYTLPYLVATYTNAYSNSSLSNFNNQKALLYGLMVVQSVENTEKNVSANEIKYGINNLDNEEIVGMKYTNIEFIEGTQEFIVTTEENKVGLITSDGTTRVAPQYDALKQIDKDRNLYLATNGNKSGVIERNGKILIYLEYDQVGIDLTQFVTNDIKNKYILYDNAIPVKQNGKWGLYDIDGKLILPIEYTSMGCVTQTSSNKSLNNVLVIPEIEGIVVGQEFEEDSRKVTYYGIYNSTGKELVRVCLENVYSITASGQEQYTMIYNGNSIDVIEYVKEWVLPQESEVTNTNTVNEVANEVTNNTNNINAQQVQEVTSDIQEQTVQQEQQEQQQVQEQTQVTDAQPIAQ